MWFFVQAFLCEGESKEKFLAAKLDLNAKIVAQSEAQERLHIAREALNEKHRELMKTTRNDPVKVTTLGALELGCWCKTFHPFLTYMLQRKRDTMFGCTPVAT